jgi:hypothetical protein
LAHAIVRPPIELAIARLAISNDDPIAALRFALARVRGALWIGLIRTVLPWCVFSTPIAASTAAVVHAISTGTLDASFTIAILALTAIGGLVAAVVSVAIHLRAAAGYAVAAEGERAPIAESSRAVRKELVNAILLWLVLAAISGAAAWSCAEILQRISPIGVIDDLPSEVLRAKISQMVVLQAKVFLAIGAAAIFTRALASLAWVAFRRNEPQTLGTSATPT